MRRTPGAMPRLIGAINVMVGVCVIARNFGWLAQGGIVEWFFMLRGAAGGFPLWERLLIFALSAIVVPVLPLAKIGTGCGLLFARRWAYRSTILVVLLDFLINLYSTINFVNLEPAIPSIPYHGGDTLAISMLPIYLTALFDLFVIAILTRDEMRAYFERRQPVNQAGAGQ